MQVLLLALDAALYPTLLAAVVLGTRPIWHQGWKAAALSVTGVTSRRAAGA